MSLHPLTPQGSALAGTLARLLVSRMSLTLREADVGSGGGEMDRRALRTAERAYYETLAQFEVLLARLAPEHIATDETDVRRDMMANGTWVET